MSAEAPGVRFLFAHPAHFIALGFGAGLAPFAPGTFGTLLAIPLWLVLRPYGDLAFLALVAACFAIGVWACAVTGRDLETPDHGAMVWDEGVAFMLVLHFAGGDGVQVAIAFLLFRLFDIVKPPPIRQLDAAMKNGLGVMADDVLAALYTLVVLALWQRFAG